MTWRVDSETFEGMRHLCTLAGVTSLTEADAREAERRDDSDAGRRRTCVHEAGHCLSALLYAGGTRFDSVRVRADGGGALVMHPEGGPFNPAGAPHPARVALAIVLGGAVAEELLVGAVEPTGVHPDLRRAAAVVGHVRVDSLQQDASGMHQVQAAVRDVRALLTTHRPALEWLASTLGAEGSLRRDTIIERLKAEVGFDFYPHAPAWEPLSPPDVIERMRTVQHEHQAMVAARRVPA